jgi:hypothetical protein
MNARYDIFKYVDGSPIWTGTANSSHEITLKLQTLMSESVRECLVVDQLTGHRSIVANPTEVEVGTTGCRTPTPSSYRHP